MNLTQVNWPRVRPKLPLFINQQNKFKVGLFTIGYILLTYMIPNHFPLREAQELPLSFFDNAIPFSPISFWIYWSSYPFWLSGHILGRNQVKINMYFYTYIFVSTLSALFFWAYPTTFPRSSELLSGLDSSFLSLAIQKFWLIDKPTNCLPSMHVCSSYLMSFVFWGPSRKEKWIFSFLMFYSTLIFISTISTKQHYMVDGLAGFLFALVTVLLFRFGVDYYLPESVIKRD